MVLVVARQEQLRDSLQVLLTSLAEIDSVEAASDVSPNLVKAKGSPPALVLLALDSSYTDAETWLTLHHIKSTWPNARIAVLVEDDKQYRVVQIAGADVIMFNGIIAAQMLKQIGDLLSEADQ